MSSPHGPVEMGRATLKLDSYDRRILAKVQAQGDLGPAELSEMIHLSTSQCSRRLQRLRTGGYIRSVVALLDTAHLQIGVIAFALVRLKLHAPDSSRTFHERIRSIAEVTECHKLTGKVDYLLKICTKSLETYNALLNQRLLAAPEIRRVQSFIVLESPKATTELPLEYV